MIRRRGVLNTRELQDIIENEWSESEEDRDVGLRRADNIDVVILPPDRVDHLTDNEDMDDDEQVINDTNQHLPNEVAGQLEVEYIYNDDNPTAMILRSKRKLKKPEAAPRSPQNKQYKPSSSQSQSRSYVRSRRATPMTFSRTQNEAQPSSSPVLPICRAQAENIDKFPSPKWSRRNYTFSEQPVDVSAHKIGDIYEKYGTFNPAQLLELFIDKQVIEFITDMTNVYAADNNSAFNTNAEEIKRFIAIMFLTGYNTLPNIHAYWSGNTSCGNSLVKNAMSRDRFKLLKSYFHVCDNKKLDQRDKFAKVTTLNEMMNRKFMQFGVFAHHLSVDEQMIPYYGRHSCKMYIKGKPIRFRYKMWCLASSDGYLFQFMPYAGANDLNKQGYGLGENVVLQLLSVLENPRQHTVTFDNFFTSHKLLCGMKPHGYFATGTVRNNRTNHATLKDIKTIRRLDRGAFDWVFDTRNKILALRWNDNSVVTILTNHIRHDPLHRAKRYDRRQSKHIFIDQPDPILKYNKRMGGVDLVDNGIANYRIRMRGKKWYWPLITNVLDAAMVNAWKLHVMFAKIEKRKPMGQFEFRRGIVETWLPPIESQVMRPNRSFSTMTTQQKRIREDRIGHIVQRGENYRRCKQCGGKTYFACTKCNVCLHPKNCFESYQMARFQQKKLHIEFHIHFNLI